MKTIQGRGAAILVLAAMLAASGCGRKEEVKENQPPEIKTFRISPKSPRVGTKLTTVITTVDKDNDPVNLEYQWFVNKQKIGAAGNELDTTEIEAGSEIYALVRAVEKEKGKASEWTKSNSVTLEGAAPMKLKGVSISPNEIFGTTEPEAVVDFGSLDPESVDEVYFRWLVNGEPLDLGANYGPRLETDYFKHGDTIQVLASADENFPSGFTASSAIYTVINSPPTISREVRFEQDGETAYLYVEASDPDGDDLTYSLINPPEGITIDESSGEISMDLAVLPSGRYNLKIVVTDGFGGEASLTYPANLKKPGG